MTHFLESPDTLFVEYHKNKAEHAVQSYAAGIGGRGLGDGEHLVLHCQNRGQEAGGAAGWPGRPGGPEEHSSTNLRPQVILM